MEAPNSSDMILDDDAIESSSAVGESRSKKTTSTVWEFFEKIKINGKKVGKCKACGKIYAEGGTSNMKRHSEKLCVGRDRVVVNREFNQDIFKDIIAKAMIKHNLPFKFVEYDGIREAFSYLNPQVVHYSRNTAKANILKIYQIEKEKLKKVLESIDGRICLTSDLWTSIACNGYMTVTAHYVDNDWVLQSKVLVFRHIDPPHTGVKVCEKLISFLQEWGLEKRVLTLTLDNAKYNDNVIEGLTNHLRMTNSLFFNGEFLHIRCGAHILNLIVQMGLGAIGEATEKVRESVKYMRSSEMRAAKFRDCVKQLNIKETKKLTQDIPIRWNSTYLMLSNALLYKDAFTHMGMFDNVYKCCPSFEEWERVEKIAEFLQPFYKMTELFSGTHYPTSNLYFEHVLTTHLEIQSNLGSGDPIIKGMATKMKEKFDKYWKEYSTILVFAVVLDPRYKLRLVKFAYEKVDPGTASTNVDNLKDKMKAFFEEYLQASTSTSSTRSVARASGRGFMNEFDASLSQEDVVTSLTQLEMYLAEPLLNRNEHEKLDLLQFWKSNMTKYPQLSLMARDILSIPITTVASESTFSHGGRIFGKFRSMLLPQNAEALVCARDWLEVPNNEDEDVEEELLLDFENSDLQIGSTSLDSHS